MAQFAGGNFKVCMPVAVKPNNPIVGTDVTVIGWGRNSSTDENAFPTVLQMV